MPRLESTVSGQEFSKLPCAVSGARLLASSEVGVVLAALETEFFVQVGTQFPEQSDEDFHEYF